MSVPRYLFGLGPGPEGQTVGRCVGTEHRPPTSEKRGVKGSGRGRSEYGEHLGEVGGHGPRGGSANVGWGRVGTPSLFTTEEAPPG